MSNPAQPAAASLSPLPLPDHPRAWEGWLHSRCDAQVAEAGARVAALRDAGPGSVAVLDLWNDVNLALANALGAASLTSQVHPDADRRDQAERAEVEARRFRTDLLLDSEVYAALSSVPRETLDAAPLRVLDHSLRDFRRAGVDRDEVTRERLRAINERETELRQAFSRGIRDDHSTTTVSLDELAGLPPDWVGAHPAGDAGSANQDRVELTTANPDTNPFLTFAHDAQARRRVLTTFLNRAWPGNDGILTELLGLRAEHAELLGYDSWPDYDVEVKMIGSGPQIGTFIDRIAQDAGDSGRRDLAVLLDRARRDDPATEVIDVAAWRYYAETVRRERYDVDAQEVRRYFDFGKVRQGLLDVTGRLFGLVYTHVADAPVWHDEVTAYDVGLVDEGLVDQGLGDEPLGRIYLDLHPREGKYDHAAQFDLVPGIRGRQLPEGVLVCNFPRGLMEHGDVVTLFHEFGHLVHHVLAGRHDWVRFSGVATEWDFVEAPSQMLEEWAWDAEVLRSFATDDAGEPIPTALVGRMRAANDFGTGYLVRTQTFYAALSYLFHLEQPVDLTARMLDLSERYNLVMPLPDTHFYAGFGHLEGYGSGYYTYLWSLVIAKDLFSAFDPDDLFAPETARRYRDLILAAGGSKDAADLVEDFLGRPYAEDAFRSWLGDAADPVWTLAGDPDR